MQTALSYLVKGAEIALNRTFLLEHENRQLRMAVERKNTKQRRNQHQIDGLNSFTIQEAREAFTNAQAAEEAAGDTGPAEGQPRRRAPPRCTVGKAIFILRRSNNEQQSGRDHKSHFSRDQTPLGPSSNTAIFITGGSRVAAVLVAGSFAY
ncbi:hypothetical protein BO99DRAFT_417760 [Aspergillus violaceofuscus CBS 115571]|uniref:Uncharacterized protein n=1 Tax=Aspergillus violaceofuscus (strain CBS 115571) TaxID=1450538 RepID=A0A2V5HMT1_ASPV1|nr:hypothetical protein BO99DRAFT_417760 [Aspergillus violaceofuscus CBS 115571]